MLSLQSVFAIPSHHHEWPFVFGILPKKKPQSKFCCCWNIVDLECFFSFRCTAKWFSYTCICSFSNSFPFWVVAEYWAGSLSVIHFKHSSVYLSSWNCICRVSINLYSIYCHLPQLPYLWCPWRRDPVLLFLWRALVTFCILYNRLTLIFALCLMTLPPECKPCDVRDLCLLPLTQP